MRWNLGKINRLIQATFHVILTQDRVIGEEGPSTEKIPPSSWTVG